jgi:hypothetical protein
VLLEGVLARTWEHLEQPLSKRQLGARLEVTGLGSNSSSDPGVVLEHLLKLGLIAAETDGMESA